MGLPAATARALGLAALEPDNDITVVASALRAASGDVADLEPAERDGLVLTDTDDAGRGG